MTTFNEYKNLAAKINKICEMDHDSLSSFVDNCNKVGLCLETVTTGAIAQITLPINNKLNVVKRASPVDFNEDLTDFCKDFISNKEDLYKKTFGKKYLDILLAVAKQKESNL